MTAQTLTRSTTAKPSTTNINDAEKFLANFSSTLDRVFHDRIDADLMESSRGIPSFVMRDVLAAEPVRAFIPSKFGGYGDTPIAGQAMLDLASYHSMSLGLTLGINSALFVQPVAKYADEQVAARVLNKIGSGAAMGGLMITEPDFGTDALGMRTSWHDENGRYRIRGTKHWAGLTGCADYWLMMARPMNDSGDLSQGVDMFICEQDDPQQKIEVIEYYKSLGLYGIPYGKNKVDVSVPADHRLQGGRGGLRMMLDTLHRSRVQFPAMSVGFVRRMVDEAIDHCHTRVAGGKRLVEHDQVRSRLARMQGQLTAISALGLYAAENAHLEHDLSRIGREANAIKSVCTDYMHDSAHSLLQLVGAKGYRQDHIAGRAIVDARPFQIFEGSNDVLYAQVGTKIVETMRKKGTDNLGEYLRNDPATARAAEVMGAALNVVVCDRPQQRRLVEVGAVFARVFALEAVLELGSRGFAPDHIAAAIGMLREDAGRWLNDLRAQLAPDVAPDSIGYGAWMPYLKA
ncbi:alkylation response protein AidB-like acyl-CoA dehydrogenase [Antricoccus suffuscus]|uniref:Alkylation response protein AidB-like acyl-CoA dehydrogenase n=1 Tax=Antricoccus suffuscus TaxID=1629062 RepID=A0A2T1A6C9_9ACTN|nr:acyl-CoA dehydrogenase [Antricoccus suffuscus]PRZ44151.1 alkylation response protein AidB-like acyl-CoA dehydrogenase [Antricoccus suffuscus]